MLQVTRRAVLGLTALAVAAIKSLRISVTPSSPIEGDACIFTYSGLTGKVTYHSPQALGWSFTGSGKTWNALAPPAGSYTVQGSATANGRLMATTINIQVRSAGVVSLDQTFVDPVNLRETISVAQGHVLNRSDTINLTDVATVTLSTTAMVMMLGCSTSPNDHGGTEEWEGWRTYNEGSLYDYVDRVGAQRPKFMAYSKAGSNLGGTVPNYTSVFNEVKADLDAFYYTGGAGSQTHSSRWGIKLFWSNGNENHDKGALSFDINNPPSTSQTPWPHTQTQIDNYIVSQSALYDAVHFIDGTTGQRRFPDAYAGSNPTHDAEKSGFIADYLHPSAPWHDFVMWSMYPPGRKTTTTDPTFNWPSFVDADWDNSPQGFLVRCYRRTKLAEAGAGHPLLISTGEIGIGNSPAYNELRPYYAVYGLLEGMMRLATQYDLVQPFACWWDQQTDSSTPQNILSDEDPATDPSTRQAWQNHLAYNTYRGGTKPASWAGTPKAGWKDTGTPL
jgi:hypothetical protein